MVNRLAYLGASFRAKPYARYFRRWVNTYERDGFVKKQLSLIKRLARKKKVKIKNRTELNFAVNFLIEQNKAERALAEYLKYDRNLDFSTNGLLQPLPLQGVFETFTDQVFTWQVVSQKTTFSRHDGAFAGTMPLDGRSMVYLNKRTNIFEELKVQQQDSYLYTTGFDFRSSSAKKRRWSTEATVKKSELASLFRVYLGRPAKEARIALSSKEAVSKINFWNQSQPIYDFIKEKPVAKSWNFLVERTSATNVYLSFVQFYLEEFSKDPQKSQIDLYYSAKERLKQRFPESEDYNSVYLIYN